MRVMRASALVLVAALACQPASRATLDSPATHAETPALEFVVYERSVVESLTLLPDGAGVVAIGVRRPEPESSTFEAWLAILDLEGRVTWQTSAPGHGARPESLLVDPTGGLHVFGRSPSGESWLLQCRRGCRAPTLLALPPLPLAAWGLVRTELHLELVGPDPDTSLWYRMPTATEELPAPLECGTSERCDELDDIEFDEDPSTLLEVAVPARISLGTSSLLALQLPPQEGHDARFLIGRRDDAQLETERAELERLAATAAWLRDVPRDDASWAWTWPLFDLDDLTSTPELRSELIGWLTAEDCEPHTAASDCDQDVLSYAGPAGFTPSDPCWREAQLPDVLDTLGRQDFVASIDTWIALVTRDYPSDGPGVDDDVEFIDSPAEAILAAAERHDATEPFILPLLELDNSEAIALALSYLATLPPARAEALAREQITALRDDRGSCEVVRALVDTLDVAPAWTADRSDPCDILYVLCTGLEPGLADAVVPPRGYWVVETCDDSRPTSRNAAREQGIEPCTPKRERFETLELTITPTLAEHCGSDAELAEVRYTCGALIELEIQTVEFTRKPDGSAELSRIEILHTTGD